MSLRNKNPATEDKTGYNKLMNTHTDVPMTITGILPTLSAIFPLKGLEIMAVIVNNEMINPLYSAPPRLVRYAGNFGMIILKLAKKSTELKHKSQNWEV